MSIVSPRESDIGTAEGAGIAGVKEARSAYGFGAANCEIQCRREDTPLGGLPGDWRYVELAELAAFRTGPFGSALHKSDYVRGGVPLINPMHIQDGVLVPDESTSVTEDAADKLAVFRMRAGEIVMGRRGDMGRCAVIQPEQSGWLCGTGSLVIRCGQLAEPAFLQRILASDQVIRAIEDSSVGTTMINLNQAALSKIRVPLPGIPEQRAIAEALSDVDGLLGALDALIAKKRAIKQAAMQQLLTGKTRLPGFSEKWPRKRLGDMAIFLKGAGLPKSDLDDHGEWPCVHYGELFTRYGELIDRVQSRTHANSGMVRSQSNDVLMPTSDVTPNGLAKASCLDEQEVILGGDILVIRAQSSQLNGTFLAYQIRMRRSQIMQLVTGSTVFHLYGRDMANFAFEAPARDEQDGIVKVLTEMGDEVRVLEQRRQKVHDIKKGMMQQLLTGRVRLVPPSSATTEASTA